MTFWTNIFAWLGGVTSQRNVGSQPIGPMHAEEAASPVTEETAMQVSAVWACVRLLAETVSSLDLTVYKDTENGKEVDKEHWFNALMSRPNRYQTRIEFLETMMLNLVLHGNAYARVIRVGGRVRSLMPLMASQVEVNLLYDGSIVYQYTADGRTEFLSEESVWHVKLYGNGIVGMSPLHFGRDIIGIARAGDKAVTKVYGNGAKPSGVLTFDRLLTKEQRDAIRANFDEVTTGDNNRLVVLEAGGQFQQVSMSPQDIELLASRRYQLEEICRWYGVPSVLVNDTSGSTTWGSGIAELVTGFYKLNLRPYLVRFESSIKAHLLNGEEDRDVSVRFEFEDLLRADLKSRLEGYRTAVAGTIMTPNEVRKVEGWPAVEGGDSLLSQVNMAPIEQLGQNTTTGAQNAPQTPDT